MLKEYGAVINSSNKYKVVVSEVEDHIDIPEYPSTNKNGILHFIHTTSELGDGSKKTLDELINRYMSKVSCAYAGHVLA